MTRCIPGWTRALLVGAMLGTLALGCSSSSSLEPLIQKHEQILRKMQNEATLRSQHMRKVELLKQRWRKERGEEPLPDRPALAQQELELPALPDEVGGFDIKGEETLARLRETQAEIRRLDKILSEVRGLAAHRKLLEEKLGPAPAAPPAAAK